MIYRSANGVYRSELLDQLAWLTHGFGTRHASPWAEDDPRATLKQIHSTIVHRIESSRTLTSEGDGLVTNAPDIWIGVKTADCVPVLLADRENRAIAAIHAGWRGSADGIALTTLRRLRAEFGSDPENIFAAIGPAIGNCCYEVGAEVATRFQCYFPERNDLSEPAKIDLREAVRRQLEHEGVPAEQIDVTQICTRCEPAVFYSYRREQELSGRMYSAAKVTAS